MFSSTEGYIECCMCAFQDMEVVDAPDSPLGFYLTPKGKIIKTNFNTNEEAIAHLEEHVKAGDSVPERAFERLRDPEDAEYNRKLFAEVRAKKLSQKILDAGG